jgi:DNA-binding transcriptional MerR regulator
MMKPQKQNSNTRDIALDAYKNDAFDNGFYQYFKERKGNRISEILNDRNRKVLFKNITYRQISGWEKEGLLDKTRVGNEWRKFSVMDAIWLKIIHELRNFGMSWNQIKVTKESLEFQNKKCGVAMPLLEFYTAFAIANKMPVMILVFNDGVAIPANYTQYKVSRDFLGLDNHIQLSLNNIIQGFFPDVDLKPNQKIEIPVDLDEMELLAFIRLNLFEKVEIKLKSGKMTILEGTERLSLSDKLTDIVRQHDYQKIEFDVAGGKKVSFVRKVQHKIKNKK